MWRFSRPVLLKTSISGFDPNPTPAGIADRVAECTAPLRSSASAALSNPPLETCLQRRERRGFAFRRLWPRGKPAMHPATLFLRKGWRFTGSTRPCAGAASRPVTLLRMMAKHVNLAVNVAIFAALCPCPPALGTFGHVLALQFEKLGAVRPSIKPLQVAFRASNKRLNSCGAHVRKLPSEPVLKPIMRPRASVSKGLRAQACAPRALAYRKSLRF